MTQTEEKRVYLIAHLDAEADRKMGEWYGLLRNAGLCGTQTPDFPHHITLGDFDLSEEETVLARAKSVCEKTRAFMVEYNHIGLSGLNVLFAAPSVNCSLLALRRQLVPEKPAPDKYEWVAHTTLLMDEPEAVMKAIPIVARAFTPFTARVEAVGVYEFFPPKELARFPLPAQISVG